MKYYTIDGPDEGVLGVFRVNNKGIPEAWKNETKEWEYKPYLWEYTTFQNLMCSEITPARAAELIDQTIL